MDGGQGFRQGLVGGVANSTYGSYGGFGGGGSQYSGGSAGAGGYTGGRGDAGPTFNDGNRAYRVVFRSDKFEAKHSQFEGHKRSLLVILSHFLRSKNVILCRGLFRHICKTAL